MLCIIVEFRGEFLVQTSHRRSHPDHKNLHEQQDLTNSRVLLYKQISWQWRPLRRFVVFALFINAIVYFDL